MRLKMEQKQLSMWFKQNFLGVQKHEIGYKIGKFEVVARSEWKVTIFLKQTCIWANAFIRLGLKIAQKSSFSPILIKPS